jgi:hypothetical protein
VTPEEEIEALELEQEQRRRAAGGKPAPTPAPEAPAEPTMWEKAREGVKGAGRALMDMSRTQQDAGAAALRGASLGLDDELAALAARAGGLVQRQRDADDMAGMGGGESVLESWRATAPLGDEARAERRGEVAAAKQRSPIAAGGAEALAALGTGIAAPGAQGGRLAQVLSGAGTGAIAGAGMGDAEGEDMAVDALMGGAIGGAAGVAVPAVGALARRAGGVLRPRGVPAAPAPALVSRTQAADVAQAVANEGPYGAARKFLVGKVADKLRGPAPAPGPVRTPYEQALDDAMARMESAPAANVLRPKQKPLPEFDIDVIDDVEPIAVQADDIIDEVATASPPLQPDDVFTTPQAAGGPAPPAPARGPTGEVLTDLRRATLGRRPTQTEIRDAVEAVAIREGTTDIATLANKTGVPTTQLRDVLVPMLRDFKFREAVKAGAASRAPVTSAIAEADEMGRTIRDAQQAARSPIDNVSGRPANQVAAVMQQEKWRSAFDALPAEQRSTFIEQLRNTSGLSDDAIRQRLKLTKAEWRRTSFERSKARSASPVLRPKVEEPSPSGGEGESESLTDMEMESLVERARDTLRLHAPWAVDKAGALPMESLERLAQIGAGNLPKTAVPGGLSPRAWTEVTLKKSGIQNVADAVAPVQPPAPKPAPVIRPKRGKTFYHTTSAGDMDAIAEMGLQPQSRPSKFGGGYEGNSQGRLFLAGTDDAAKEWAWKVENALFGESDDVIRQTPVSLRVKVAGKVKPDTVGSRDVPDSFFTEEGVGPESIEFFDGESWKPLSEWAYSEGRTYVPKTFAETKKVLRKK